MGRGKKALEKESSRVTPYHFDKETGRRVKEEEEPEDFAIESFPLFHPNEKEEDG